jgi:hypothetical protein
LTASGGGGGGNGHGHGNGHGKHSTAPVVCSADRSNPSGEPANDLNDVDL